MDSDASSGEGQQHAATGTVTAIEDGKITLAHGPVPSLDWPAMTMPFQVQTPSLMNDVQVGDEVRFSFARQGTAYVITQVTEL